MVTNRLRVEIVRGWAGRWAPALLAAGLALALGPAAWSAPGGVGPAGVGRTSPSRAAPARWVDPSKRVLPSDDWTFRPTVLVRRGASQGSGTIIASVDGQSLVLTASHVVGEAGPISVELHRYNLGLERTPAAPGVWPRTIEAEVVALDRAADLAVLRIRTPAALPYVARLAPGRRDPEIDSVVTSVGIDLGQHLSSWSSRLVESLWFELNDNREERLFFITARVPEHGRSGGGLFTPDGELVGVCIGHAELLRGRRQGVFASRESIRRLLADHGLDPVVVRSEVRRARPGRKAPGTASSSVTPTGAVDRR